MCRSHSLIVLALSLSSLLSVDVRAYCGGPNQVAGGGLSTKEQRVAFIETWILQDKSVKAKIPTLSSDEEQLLLTRTSSLRENLALLSSDAYKKVAVERHLSWRIDLLQKIAAIEERQSTQHDLAAYAYIALAREAIPYNFTSNIAELSVDYKIPVYGEYIETDLDAAKVIFSVSCATIARAIIEDVVKPLLKPIEMEGLLPQSPTPQDVLTYIRSQR
jgi:hypothetical protein